MTYTGGVNVGPLVSKGPVGAVGELLLSWEHAPPDITTAKSSMLVAHTASLVIGPPTGLTPQAILVSIQSLTAPHHADFGGRV